MISKSGEEAPCHERYKVAAVVSVPDVIAWSGSIFLDYRLPSCRRRVTVILGNPKIPLCPFKKLLKPDNRFLRASRLRT